MQALWDLIAETPEDVPVPKSHQSVIEQRLGEAKSSAVDVKSWSEVRADLHQRLRSARD